MNINRALDMAIDALNMKRGSAADNLRRCRLEIERSPDNETTLHYQRYAAEYEAGLSEVEGAIAALRAAAQPPADGSKGGRGAMSDRDPDARFVLRIAEMEACQNLYALCEHYRRLGMTADEAACMEFAQTLASRGHLRMMAIGAAAQPPSRGDDSVRAKGGAG